jgi:hypothetical protein
LALVVAELSPYPNAEIFAVGEDLFNYERVLQRGGPELNRVLIAALKALLSEMPQGNIYSNLYRYFIRALEEHGIPLDAFAQRYQAQHELPWSHVHYPTHRILGRRKRVIERALDQRGQP